ncbi:MAG: hypothetical protein ACREAB_18615 [Blastocatellia bacterium]
MGLSVLLRLAAIGGLMLVTIAGLAAQARQKQRGVAEAMVAVNDPKALAAYHRGRSKLMASDAQIARVRAPVLGIIST